MAEVSIIIPARTEKFLNNTIKSVLDNAVGDIEVIPVLDGYGDTPYEKIDDPRVRYISLPVPHDGLERHKRQAINVAVSISHGKYICWLDAHCAVGKGFDEILAKDCQDNWVMVPRRCRMDVENWTGTNWVKPPIDYEYYMWQHLKNGRIAGYKWDIKTVERMNVPIDDIFTAQGSFFFMTRKWFDYCRFMKIDGYTGWGQEGEEVCLTTIQNGGRAMVNKNTWYAHLHKGKRFGRMYKWSKTEPSYNYSFNYWVHQNKEFFISIIDRFGPFPGWWSNWKGRIYGHK